MMTAQEFFSGEAGVLRRLLELSTQTTKEAGWPMLSRDGLLHGLACTFFLLDEQPGLDVARFGQQELVHLLGHLSRRTEQRRTELHGRVRGRVDWSATHKARFAQAYDPTRFVCRESHHRFDTPENQLLHYLIAGIGRALGALPDFLRSGASIVVDRPIEQTYHRLAAVETAIRRAQRSSVLRQVSLPPRIEAHHLYRAQVADMEEYRAVSKLYNHYHTLIEELDVARVHAYVETVGRTRFPLPARLNENAEAWLRLGVELLFVSRPENRPPEHTNV